MLTSEFFNRDPSRVASALLGKVIRVFYKQQIWLSAQIIETEAYYKKEKASHASLGFTEKRKALFMKPGTIYMYYARGSDSLNVSCRGPGNAVLIKSAIPYLKDVQEAKMLALMQQLNPRKNSSEPREPEYLCSGQTLLCKSLELSVKDWDKQQFCPNQFYIEDCGYRPLKIIQSRRLGIPLGRDEHLLYRWVDWSYADAATENPLRRRSWMVDQDYFIVSVKD